MRSVFACFAWIAVWFGLQGRVLGVDTCDWLLSAHEARHEGHHHDPGKPCDPSHDDGCPLEHHQHGGGCHAMPITNHVDPSVGLRDPSASLLRLLHEGERVPEEPCLGEDEPPII